MRLLNNKPLLITIVVAIILVLLLFVIPGGAKISGVESWAKSHWSCRNRRRRTDNGTER